MNSLNSYQPKVLVFTATYNEIYNVEPLLDEISQIAPLADILVVDDDSPDGTGQKLDQLKLSYPNLVVIHRRRKRGLGTAHSLAIIYAIKNQYDVLITMDADRSHSPFDIPRLIKRLNDEEQGKCDFVIGSRYMKGGSCDYGGYRKLLSVGGNWLTRMSTGIPIHEFTTSFRAFRVAKLGNLNMYWMKNRGYSFFLEVATQLHRAGLKFAEIPIHFHDRSSGESKIPRLEIFRGMKKLFSLNLARILPSRFFGIAHIVDGFCPDCSGVYLYKSISRDGSSCINCVTCNAEFKS